jgi:hypothetical protein
VSDTVSLAGYNRVGPLAGALVLSLLCLWAAPVQASSINATATCGTGDPVTGVITWDIHVSVTPGVGTSATQPTCSNLALADYGVLKVYSASTDKFTTSQGSATFSIDFFLTDASLGADVLTTIYVPIAYDFSLAAGTSGYAEFSMTQDYITRYVQTSSYDNPFGGNNCPNPAPTIPSCNGRYSGTILLPFSARINSTTGPNRFGLELDSRASAGVSDAYNTVKIGTTILASNLGFSYADLGGNPMNFGYDAVPPPPAVPEPATLSMAGLGLVMIARRLRRGRPAAV